MTEITLRDKLSCVRRELRLRKQTYPGCVRRGTMTQALADYQLALMEAIVADYERLVTAVEAQGVLCTEEGHAHV